MGKATRTERGCGDISHAAIGRKVSCISFRFHHWQFYPYLDGVTRIWAPLKMSNMDHSIANRTEKADVVLIVAEFRGSQKEMLLLAKSEPSRY